MSINPTNHHKSHLATRVMTFIVFVVLAVVLVQLTKSVKNNPPEENTNPIVETNKIVDMVQVIEIPLTSESKYGTVSGAYPQFKNANSIFNDKIRNAVVIAQSEFENNTMANWQAQYDTKQKNEKMDQFPPAGEFTFSVKTDYVQVNKDIISILISVSGFSGGAHGYENLISFNYNVKTNQEISLIDIFPNDIDYLKTLSTYSRKDLTDQFTSKIKNENMDDDGDFKMTMENINSMLLPGTEPKLANFSVFTISPDVLNIHFPQYQVAAYVYGSQLVKMPFK